MHPLASRRGSGTSSATKSDLLTAFAAVFLGSAIVRDQFHVLGTLIGALIIAFGFKGMNIFGTPTFSRFLLRRDPRPRGRVVEPRPLHRGKLTIMPTQRPEAWTSTSWSSPDRASSAWRA